MMFRQPRQEDAEHRKFVGTLPCVVCGDDTSTEAAHVRYADLAGGKRSTGMAEKSDDAYTVPLCGRCHRQQHSTNERQWWRGFGIDPVKVALALWKWSGDHAMGVSIVQANSASRVD